MVKNSLPIRFHFASGLFYLPHRQKLKRFILGLFHAEKHQVNEVNYIFCSDDYLLKINRDFLQHDYYTDIITFPYQKKGEPIHSDIYISVDRVRENALNQKASFQNELQRVIIHGALHLCGYRDKSKRETTRMREMEDHYLSKFHVSRGTRD